MVLRKNPAAFVALARWLILGEKVGLRHAARIAA